MADTSRVDERATATVMSAEALKARADQLQDKLQKMSRWDLFMICTYLLGYSPETLLKSIEHYETYRERFPAPAAVDER